jgi:hypothetical protein
MIQAFAPRQSGGFSRVLLSIVVVGVLALPVRSQPTTKKEAAPAGAAGAGGAAAPAAGQNPPAENAEPLAPPLETYRDSRAEKCLQNTFPVLGKPGRPAIVNQVKAMSGNQAPVERQTIEQFVDLCINDLTHHAHIKAVIDPDAGVPPGAGAHFAIQQATDNLLEPILSARAVNNSGFLSMYDQILLQKLPPLLDNHLLARISAMIVLSQTAVPEAVEIFIKQLGNPDQTVWVALWAARGLTNIQQVTRYNLDAPRAIRAAKAVADFLEREKDLPWPVQYRALEALGSLRLANTPQMTRGQPEMAGTATQFLTAPDGRLEVRAEAGWALGMMVVPAGINQYNFTMLAYTVGEVAATLGERVKEVYPKNVTQAEQWTALLVTQILQTFDGIDTARDSGLLKSPHPAANAARPFMKQVSDKARPLAASAVRLVREPAGRSAANLKDLDAKLADLKSMLDKNRPPNTWLVPGGPNFPLAGAQVAKAPGGAAQVLGKPAAAARRAPQ